MSQPDQSAPADPLRAPHQPISGYYQTEDERAGFLREIFDSTATDYDKVERTLALGTGPWYRRRALERGFVRSEPADWPGLLSAIAATGAARVIVTHGQVAPLVRWLAVPVALCLALQRRLKVLCR